MRRLWKLIRWIMGHRILYIPKPVNPLFYPEYGLLYNYYAQDDARNICNTGWHVPTFTEVVTLRDYLGGITVAGGKLKETGLTYFQTPNTGATNEVSFNGRGAGNRGSSGSFIKLNIELLLGVNYESGGASIQFGIASYINDDFGGTVFRSYEGGNSVRLIKDSTTLSHGQAGTYTGNDGKIYRTICIGTQEWLADNLSETRFRNGDIIPWHGANPASYFTNAEWAALTTAGVCAYDNTLSNVAAGFTFST